MSTTPAPTSQAPAYGEPKPGKQEQLTHDTFNRHVAAFCAAKLHDVLDDFAQDAVVITPDGVFEGRDAIRTVYEGLLHEFGSITNGDSPGISVDVLHIRDNTLFITWHAESLHHVFDFGTDTFVMEGSKIRRQTIAYTQPSPRAAQV